MCPAEWGLRQCSGGWHVHTIPSRTFHYENTVKCFLLHLRVGLIFWQISEQLQCLWIYPTGITSLPSFLSSKHRFIQKRWWAASRGRFTVLWAVKSVLIKLPQKTKLFILILKRIQIEMFVACMIAHTTASTFYRFLLSLWNFCTLLEVLSVQSL